jgi:hypothetical protein
MCFVLAVLALLAAFAMPASAQTVETGPPWTPVIRARATCDGTTDATASILASFASVPAGGATISLPSGVCMISAPLALPNNTRLVGQGRQATTIRMVANTGNFKMITNVSVPGSFIEVLDLTVDGNRANEVGTSNSGISFLQVSNLTLKDIEVANLLGIGIFLDGNGITTTTGAFVSNVYTHDNVWGPGFWVAHAQRQTTIKGLHSLRDGSLTIAPQAAVFLDASEILADDILVDQAVGTGIYIHNVFGSSYSNLVATRSAQHGFQIDSMTTSHGSMWRAQNNSLQTAATYDDIHFTNVAPGGSYGITDNAQVTNLFVGSDANYLVAGQERNGIYVEDGVTGNVRLIGVQCANLASGTCIRQPVAPGSLVVAESKTVANTFSNLPQVANATLFTSTADAVTNTTGDLSCFGAGAGSQTIPANSVAVGTRFVLTCNGIMTTPGSNAATISYKIKWGATTVVGNTTLAIPSPAAPQFIGLDGYCTVRSLGASGSMVCTGKISTFNTSAAGIYVEWAPIASPVTIDTTTGNKLDMTAAWSTVAGGQTATFQQSTLQVVN